MNKHIRRAVAALSMAFAGAGCVINVDGDSLIVREEKRFSISGDAEVALETFDGSLRVRSWDRPEVLVEIEKHGPDREAAAALEVAATQNGNRIEVRAPAPKSSREFVGIGIVRGASVSFTVSVPRTAVLSAETRDGSITVEGATGAIDLRSGDGSIRGTDLDGDVEARTEDGSIHIEGALGALRVASGDGSVVIEAGDGSAMKGDWDISTDDGAIVFRVPETFNADIDAASDDGSVRGDLNGLERNKEDDGRQWLKGRLGSGGHRVRLRSGDGSIRVVNR